MARGWESKSVESQQADQQHADHPVASESPEDRARKARLKVLELARARAVADLAAAQRPAHRAMLEAALQALDEQIRAQ